MCHWCEERLSCRIVLRWDTMFAVCDTCQGDQAEALTRDEVARRLQDGDTIAYDINARYEEG